MGQIADDCADCRTERSIASVVRLNPVQGTATKAYQPPLLVRILYWLAFQAKFPYVSNGIALQAGDYRRKVAELADPPQIRKTPGGPSPGGERYRWTVMSL